MRRFGLGSCILHLFTLKDEFLVIKLFNKVMSYIFNCTYYIYKQSEVNSSMETNPKQIKTYIKTFKKYVFGLQIYCFVLSLCNIFFFSTCRNTSFLPILFSLSFCKICLYWNWFPQLILQRPTLIRTHFVGTKANYDFNQNCGCHVIVDVKIFYITDTF